MPSIREEIRGHTVEVSGAEERPELHIDGRRVRYGRLPGGLYFLHEYAYDWSEDLLEVTRRYLDHKARTEELLRRRRAAEGTGAS